MKKFKNVDELMFPEIPSDINKININDIEKIEYVRGIVIDKQTNLIKQQLKKAIQIDDSEKELKELRDEYDQLSHDIELYDDVLHILKSDN